VIARIVFSHKLMILRIVLATKRVVARIVLDHNRSECKDSVGS
jgi:hypothetical protein